MKKQVISLLLSCALLFSLMPTAFAASTEAETAANALYELGLFNGIGTNSDGTPNFDLDRAPSRNEAVTMLVRLLGKEEEAKAGTWTIPFTDTTAWAEPYIGYAYANGLTSGTSATTFGGNDTVSATQYITFVLRALGYESGTDFQWNKAWELSDEIGLTAGEYNADTTQFTRGDVAIISNAALSAKLKGHTITLQDSIESKVDIMKTIVLERIIIAEIRAAANYCIEANEEAGEGNSYMAGQNVSYAWDCITQTKESCENCIKYCGDRSESQAAKEIMQKIVNEVSSHSIPEITPTNWTLYSSEIVTTTQTLLRYAMSLVEVMEY